MATSPFDADDLIRRSILGSIIGFARKKPPKCSTDQHDQSNSSLQHCYQPAARDPYDHTNFIASSCQVGMIHEADRNIACAKIAHDTEEHLLQYRSQQDIYREIVCECAQLENTTASNYSSRSPSQSPPSAALGEDIAKVDAFAGKDEIFCQQSSPNVYPTVPLTTFDSRSSSAFSISIEDFVKLVVTTVKEGGFLTRKNDFAETPEEILRRKRAQNNEAAARYRKRQKELREEAEIELQIQINKNKELKHQVECMQAEIAQLKSALLNARTDSHS
ncbi:hypothetical protein Tcan_16051 [Toxocara canis]|uniref:BZIP domain-containing protein n=1 Tax=Toxocara canis TaxID=6265 RepID=A0A0B2VP34_TOXCA|nr:hypothetical protein Tcan_16051 [Toxocara canis]